MRTSALNFQELLQHCSSRIFCFDLSKDQIKEAVADADSIIGDQVVLANFVLLLHYFCQGWCHTLLHLFYTPVLCDMTMGKSTSIWRVFSCKPNNCNDIWLWGQKSLERTRTQHLLLFVFEVQWNNSTTEQGKWLFLNSIWTLALLVTWIEDFANFAVNFQSLIFVSGATKRVFLRWPKSQKANAGFFVE